MAFARARGNAGSPPIMVYSPASPCEERAVPPLAACRRSLPAVLCPLHHLGAGLATGRFFCPTRLGGAKAALQSCAPTPARGPIASACKVPARTPLPAERDQSAASPRISGRGRAPYPGIGWRERARLSRVRSRANPRCHRSPSGRCCAHARRQNAQDSWGRRPLGRCPTSLRRRRAATPPRPQSDCG